MKVKAIHSPPLPRVSRHRSLVLICMNICHRLMLNTLVHMIQHCKIKQNQKAKAKNARRCPVDSLATIFPMFYLKCKTTLKSTVRIMLDYVMSLTLWSAKYFQLIPSFVSLLEIYTFKKKGIFKNLFILKCLTHGFWNRQKTLIFQIFSVCDLRQTGNGIHLCLL